MNRLSRYIIVAAVVAVVAFLAWYFSSVLTYILISAVVSLIGKPLVRLLNGVRLGRFRFPSWLSALLTEAVILGLFFSFFLFLSPMLGDIFKQISGINPEGLVGELALPLADFNAVLRGLFPTLPPDFTVESYVFQGFHEAFSLSAVSRVFNGAAAFLVRFGVALFSVAFISFYFLMDENAFSRMILALVPDRYESNVRRALDAVDRLLVRYFLGIVLEALLITVLNSAGLYFIAGLDFSLAVVLAFVSGVINVIPYVGPLSAGAFGVLMGVVSRFAVLDSSALGWFVLTLILVFTVTHLIDVFIFQPYIYANSVRAHPLEIFIVILLAANIGGMIGMLIAIPSYTVIRVFAAEFLSRFKVVQQLTFSMRRGNAAETDGSDRSDRSDRSDGND